MLKSWVSGFVAVSLCCGAAQAAEPLKARNKPLVKAKSASQQPAVAMQLQEQHAILSDDHLAVARRVVLGKVPCELGAHVVVSAHPAVPGHFVLEHGRQKNTMAPVLTSTGAVRLEDAASGVVWLQLANKSMLMNQKQGRRLADACMNVDQVVVADAMARSPAPNLLEPLPVPSPAVVVPAAPQAGMVQTATN